MPLDPSIPLSVKGFQLESPMAQAGGALQLLNLLGQQKAREQQLQQQQTMQPLQMELLRAQIAAQQEIPAQRQAQAAKTLLDLQDRQQRQELLKQLSAEMVKPDEATALEAVRQAQARGEPANITARNQNLVNSLLAQIAPQQAATQLMKPLTQSGPLADTKAVTGGYLQKMPDNSIRFVQTQQDRPPPAEPPVQTMTDGAGNVYERPRGGQWRRVVVAPGEPALAPKPSPQAKSDAEAEQTVEGIRARIASLTQLVQQNPTAVGVAGGVRRLGEMAGGVVESLGGPSIPTPAIDFENEQALLLGDVRKLVEKDPNLSKDERERLYQTLGGGLRQTPSSAVRAMNNVLEYVERKKMTGASRERALERRVPAVGTVQGGYRFKGGDPALQENWERQ